jgi:hypothetical protein
VIDLVSKAKALVQERDKLDNEERQTKRRHLVASSDSCEESNEFTEISNSSVSNSSVSIFFLLGLLYFVKIKYAITIEFQVFKR